MFLDYGVLRIDNPDDFTSSLESLHRWLSAELAQHLSFYASASIVEMLIVMGESELLY
jgi:hypothetical protein